MIKYQKITFVFSGRIISLEVDAYPEIDRYEYWIIDDYRSITRVAIASTPISALGHSFQTMIRMAGAMPKEIWVDPVEEFISTQETLCAFARYGIWTSRVRYR